MRGRPRPRVRDQRARDPPHRRGGAPAAGAHVVYLSTDYVFDGELDRPYVEWDAPDPISVYGHSKLAGEQELPPEATIVRTSWVCGATPGNFVSLVLRLAREHDKLRFVDHERSRPTLAADLVPVLRRLAVDRRPGVHHVTNQGTATRYELAAARSWKRPGSIPRASSRSPSTSSTRPAARHARSTPSSTTPSSASKASPPSPTTATPSPTFVRAITA